METNNKYNSAQDILDEGNRMFHSSIRLNKLGSWLFVIGLISAMLFWFFGAFGRDGWHVWVFICSAFGGLGVVALITSSISGFLAPIVAGLGIIGLNTKDTTEVASKQLKLFAYLVRSKRGAHSSEHCESL